LPRDSNLVFICHHGFRSQSAAVEFRGLGFCNVFNVAGGIDAWAQHVDRNVPRY
jgi:monothiol glutaredoxin